MLATRAAAALTYCGDPAIHRTSSADAWVVNSSPDQPSAGQRIASDDESGLAGWLAEPAVAALGYPWLAVLRDG